VIADLNARLGRHLDCVVKIAVTLQAGRAVVGEVGSTDPPTMMALGETMDAAHALRASAAAREAGFAISQPALAAAGIEPPAAEKVEVRAVGHDEPVVAFLSDSAPALPDSWVTLGQQRRRAVLRRLWTR
jgi:adenylate cyclase